MCLKADTDIEVGQASGHKIALCSSVSVSSILAGTGHLGHRDLLYEPLHLPISEKYNAYEKATKAEGVCGHP